MSAWTNEEIERTLYGDLPRSWAYNYGGLRRLDALKAGLITAAQAKRELLTDETMEPDQVLAPRIRRDRRDVSIDERVLLNDRGDVIGRRKGSVVNDWLRRYWKRKEIDNLQYRAGQAFQECAELMQISVPSQLGANGQRSGYADIGMAERGQVAYMARVKWDLAAQAMGIQVYPVVVWVIIDNRPAGDWAKAKGMRNWEGMTTLKLGLNSLVTHWGLTARDSRA